MWASSKEKKKILGGVKLLALDVDGVLTDCRIWLDSNNEWRRFFSIRDGYGIVLLQAAGYEVAVITASKSRDIEERVKNLKIKHFYQGSLDKLPAFKQLQMDTGLGPGEMAYMGDDLFDLPLLKEVRFAATVPEAMDEVLKKVDYITKRPGGNGAVREVCDLIIKYGYYAREGKGK